MNILHFLIILIVHFSLSMQHVKGSPILLSNGTFTVAELILESVNEFGESEFNLCDELEELELFLSACSSTVGEISREVYCSPDIKAKLEKMIQYCQIQSSTLPYWNEDLGSGLVSNISTVLTHDHDNDDDDHDKDKDKCSRTKCDMDKRHKKKCCPNFKCVKKPKHDDDEGVCVRRGSGNMKPSTSTSAPACSRTRCSYQPCCEGYRCDSSGTCNRRFGWIPSIPGIGGGNNDDNQNNVVSDQESSTLGTTTKKPPRPNNKPKPNKPKPNRPKPRPSTSTTYVPILQDQGNQDSTTDSDYNDYEYPSNGVTEIDSLPSINN